MTEPLTPEGVRALIDDLAVVAASASHHKESRLDTGKCIECSDLWPCFDQRSADTARRAIAALSASLSREDADLDGRGPDDEMGRHVYVAPSTWGEGFDVGVGTRQNSSCVRLSRQQIADLRALLGPSRTV
ncbi:hypothetical protein [Rathayibacter sp. Leaf248]|uniref:hypothetical protein n=1 Tax=Rathayibacter sp. Leaf248 TaxID=2876555 RepID=UPI001E4AEFE9|nr:hypothetical protein [Rathayibacter sp. Leaf248]